MDENIGKYDEKACGCMIFNHDRVLLVKQTTGDWGFPKGHIEENETEEETAIREVKEETGLDVVLVNDKRYVTEYITDKANLKQVVYFIARPERGKLEAQDSEITLIGWFDVEEAKRVITYQNTKELFEEALKDMEEQQVQSY